MKVGMEYKSIENWHVNISEREPVIFCIFGGSCINQLILRDALDSFWAEHHDQHWHHGGSSRLENKGGVLNLVNKLPESLTFILPNKLNFRKEKNGFVVWVHRSAYFVNDIGRQFLQSFVNPVTIADVKRICKQLDISEQAGLDFFKKLIIFGVLKYEAGTRA